MKLILGNCLDKLKELDENSVDSIVTDPPYGISFMSKDWDYDVPKASKRDRNEGLEDTEKGCFHPTVKPTKLMQYLVRLVTPKGGTVLDPFMGSGSTGKACVLEGFDFIGMEMDEDYIKIAEARIEATNKEKRGKLKL